MGNSFWWNYGLQMDIAGRSRAGGGEMDALAKAQVRHHESVDMAKLRGLVRSGTLSRDHRQRCERYLRSPSDSVVEYAHAIGRSDGRLYSTGNAIQTLPAMVRAIVCDGYDDLDLAVSHMAMLANLARREAPPALPTNASRMQRMLQRHGAAQRANAAPRLRELVKDKDKVRHDLAEEYGCSKADIKKLLLRKLYGAVDDKGWFLDAHLTPRQHVAWVREYEEEVHALAERIVTQDEIDFARLRKEASGGDTSERSVLFSALSELCARVEQQVIAALGAFLQ